MSKIKLLLVILVALNLSCIAPSVVNNKITGGTCMTWETTQYSRCRVIYCAEGLCNSTEWDSNYSLSHCYLLPKDYSSIKIMSLNIFNQLSEYEVK